MKTADLSRKTGRVFSLLLPFLVLLAALNYLFIETDDLSRAQVEKGHVFGATYMTMNNPYYKVVDSQLRAIIEDNGDVLLTRDATMNQERQNEQRAYTNAMLSTEPLVLQNFLDMYVDAPLAHRDSIKVHLEALKKIDSDWTDALVNNSKNAYERYIKLHPSTRYNKEAMIKIDSLDWVAATKLNTV